MQQGGEDHWTERPPQIADQPKRGAGRIALSPCLVSRLSWLK